MKRIILLSVVLGTVLTAATPSAVDFARIDRERIGQLAGIHVPPVHDAFNGQRDDLRIIGGEQGGVSGIECGFPLFNLAHNLAGAGVPEYHFARPVCGDQQAAIRIEIQAVYARIGLQGENFPSRHIVQQDRAAEMGTR